MSAAAFLEAQKASNTQLAPYYTELLQLYHKKLWHQLTEKLEGLVELPMFAPGGDELIQLYDNFIRDFETRINQLKLVKIVIAISRQFTSSDDVIAFLEKVAVKVANTKDAYALNLAVQASIFLKSGQLPKCKELLEKTKGLLDSLAGIDPLVYSSYYKAAADYYKILVNPSEFYKHALQYLSYTPLESLTDQEKVAYAFDLGLAALVSETIYNFGELLAHPVVNSLNTGSLQWLYKLLFAFNIGDIAEFENLWYTYSTQISNQPALTSNQQLLKEKISVLSLLELVFRRPSHERTIPFSIIAEATKLPVNEVELLVIKSLSLKLIKGTIDQVEQVVNITWVQPRVLDLNQITSIKDKLTNWVDRVNKNLLFLERETPDLLIA